VGTTGPFPGGKARLRRDADSPPHLVPRLRISRSWLHIISHLALLGIARQL